MSFSQKEYVFTHTMNKVSEAHQPTMFKIDLQGLIPFGDCSTLFIIDNMTVTAYKQGTFDKIPAKFTVLNDNKTRVLTNDPSKLSSQWNVDINGGSCIKIAGTDTVPFNRTLSVYDDDNRQALINVLAFMMSNSLWASDSAKGALDILVASARGEFQFTCGLCSTIGLARVIMGPSGISSFSFPQCADSYVCIPSHHLSTDKDYDALRNVLALLRSACLDDLGILHRVTQEMAMASPRAFQDLDCTSFPPRHMYGEGIVIPYAVMKYVTALYQTMSEYADNIAIVDGNRPHVKVLIQSPSDNIGEITGHLSITILYGTTLWDIYTKLIHGLRLAEGCEEEDIDSIATVTQLSTEVLIRRTQLKFMLNNHMSLKDWYNFYYGSTCV